MQLAFDPRDRNQVAHVLALLNVMHPSLDASMAVDFLAPEPPAPPAAEAFDAPSAAAAFEPAPPAVPPAPPAPPVAAAAVPPAPPAAPATGAAAVEVDAKGLPWDKRIHASPPTKNKADNIWRRKRNLDDAVEAQVVAELRQVMAAPAPLVGGGAPPAPTPAATESTTAPPAPPSTPAAAVTESGPVVAAPASEAPPAPPAVPAAPPAPPAPPVVQHHDALATAVADGWAPHPTDPAYYWRGTEVVLIADVEAMYPPPAAAPPVPAAPPAPPAAGPVASFADLMRKITGMQTAGTLTVERTTAISQELGITGVRDLMHRPDLIPAFDAALPVVA